MTHGNWVLEPGKFMPPQHASRLLTVVRQRAAIPAEGEHKVAIRDYFLIDLALNTGLRVMELADLWCGDLSTEHRLGYVRVRNGKGNRKRLVLFSGPLRDHCREYLAWKRQVGESTDPEAPLFRSSCTGGHLSTRALQKAFKRCAKLANLPASYAIHCLRHTYACLLLKASNWNLRLVQKQLGHARISTTQVYADVMMPDIEKALNRLRFWIGPEARSTPGQTF